MKKWNKIIAIACGLSLTASVLTGCGQNLFKAAEGNSVEEDRSDNHRKRGGKETNPPEKETTEPTEEIDAETMELIKYNIYVEMNNYMVKLLDNIDSYYLVAAPDDEFSLLPDSKYTYGYNISYLNMDIIDDALTVADMEPALELDALTKEIAEPMRTLAETFNTINKAGGSFADNQYELPKNLHPVIQENAETFYSMALAYIDGVDTLAEEHVAKEEAKMLEEGRLIIYNASHAITLANKILDECYAQEISDVNLGELDLTNIRPLYEELTVTVNAYNEACSDKDQLMKESLSSSPLYGNLDSLVQAVEWMIGTAENHTSIREDEIDLSPLGSIGHIYEVLSNCISSYNNAFAD